jgi:alkylation response protein AidB-like acyl-CoA dehydrogenase
MTGSTAALGSARRTKGGFVISGRWPFASGILTARKVNCLCKIEGEGDPANPHLVFCHLDASEISIIDTWYVTGLKGSGSNDFSVTERFVPDANTHGFIGAKPNQPGQLFRFPIVSLLGLSVGIVPLGIAKNAIAAFVAMADRTRAGTSNPLKDRETIQSDLARAEALRRAGKALIISAIADLEGALDIGDQPLIEARAFFRVALAHSAENCLKAVEMVAAAAGTASIFEASPIARCLRDIQAATKHIAVAPHLFAIGGRIMLGMDTGGARF